MPIDPADSYDAAMRAAFDRFLANVSADLRRLADEVDRAGADLARHRANPDLTPAFSRSLYTHVGVAGSVVSTVTWGIANLGLPRLVSAGQDADDAARREAGPSGVGSRP